MPSDPGRKSRQSTFERQLELFRLNCNYPVDTLILLLFVFVLATLLGFELISKVPSQLHTPLMSGANAISGITIIGGLLAAGSSMQTAGMLVPVLGFLALVLAAINVTGGYLVTARMLAMFGKNRKKGEP